MVLLVACGGEKDKPKAAPPPPAPPPSAPADAAPTAPDAGMAAAKEPSGATCPPAFFALAHSCGADGQCVWLYEVDSTCVVRLRSELDFSALTDHVIDVAWPKKEGPLYAVIAKEGQGPVWGAVPSPLTGDAKALTKVAWKAEKIGAMEPEGFRYGVESSGDGAVFAGCEKWDEHNEEEWSCGKVAFWSIPDAKPVKNLPPPPFTQAVDKPIGKIALKKTKQGFACTGADGKATPLEAGDSEDPVVGATSLSDDTFILMSLNPGRRTEPSPQPYGTMYRGCALHPTIKGTLIPGPQGYYLRQTEQLGDWKIYRGTDETPLPDPDSNPFAKAGAVATWAAP